MENQFQINDQQKSYRGLKIGIKGFDYDDPQPSKPEELPKTQLLAPRDMITDIFSQVTDATLSMDAPKLGKRGMNAQLNDVRTKFSEGAEPSSSSTRSKMASLCQSGSYEGSFKAKKVPESREENGKPGVTTFTSEDVYSFTENNEPSKILPEDGVQSMKMIPAQKSTKNIVTTSKPKPEEKSSDWQPSNNLGGTSNDDAPSLMDLLHIPIKRKTPKEPAAATSGSSFPPWMPTHQQSLPPWSPNYVSSGSQQYVATSSSYQNSGSGSYLATTASSIYTQNPYNNSQSSHYTSPAVASSAYTSQTAYSSSSTQHTNPQPGSSSVLSLLPQTPTYSQTPYQSQTSSYPTQTSTYPSQPSQNTRLELYPSYSITYPNHLTVDQLKKHIQDFSSVDESASLRLILLLFSHNIFRTSSIFKADDITCVKRYNTLEEYKTTMMGNLCNEMLDGIKASISEFYYRIREGFRVLLMHNSYDDSFTVDYTVCDDRDGLKRILNAVFLCIVTNMPEWPKDQFIMQPNFPQFCVPAICYKSGGMSDIHVGFLRYNGIRQVLGDSKNIRIYIVCKLSSEIRELDAVFRLSGGQIVQGIVNPKQNVATKQREDAPKLKADMARLKLADTEHFNEPQLLALKSLICVKSGIQLLHGPPGTGKTHVLVGYVKNRLANLEKGRHIMITTPSNRALDEIIIRLSREKFRDKNGTERDIRCVRLGHVDEFTSQKVAECSLEQHTLNYLMENAKEANDGTTAENVTAQSEIFDRLKKLTGLVSTAQKFNDITKLKQYTEEKTQLMTRLDYLKNKISSRHVSVKLIEEGIIRNSHVLFATLNSSGRDAVMQLGHYVEEILIDEAGQSRETEVLIPLRYKPAKLVLFGDSLQLPPTILNQESLKTNFSKSLFERMMDNHVKPLFLDLQYRMHPQISVCPNKMFYWDKIRDSDKVCSRLDYTEFWFLRRRRMVFIDNMFAQEDRVQVSYVNLAEVREVLTLVDMIHNECKSKTSMMKRVGIICAYKAQKQKIIAEIRERNPDLLCYLDIDTIDGFQGREKEIIILSTVRTVPNIGFMSDYRRLNVAITRAKSGLFIFGSRFALSSDKMWSEIIKYYEANNMIFEAENVPKLFDSNLKPAPPLSSFQNGVNQREPKPSTSLGLPNPLFNQGVQNSQSPPLKVPGEELINKSDQAAILTAQTPGSTDSAPKLTPLGLTSVAGPDLKKAEATTNVISVGLTGRNIYARLPQNRPAVLEEYPDAFSDSDEENKNIGL